MDNNTSFLFHCDGELNILQIFWYSPAHLVSPYQKKLGDLFSVSDMGRIDQAVKKALSRKDVIFCEGGFRIISPGAEVCLCMMSVGDHVLIRKGMLVLATEEVVASHRDVVKAAEELGEVLLVMRIGGRHMDWSDPSRELAANP